MNFGRAFDSRGQPNARTACGRVLAWLRERSGHWVSGLDMDAWGLREGHVRAASTRKSGINHQVDPRVEWIEHEVRRGAGGNVHHYRHVWTRGLMSRRTATGPKNITPLRRIEEIDGGECVPPAGYYEYAAATGRLPAGMGRPRQETKSKPEIKAPAGVAPSRSTALPGELFPMDRRV